MSQRASWLAGLCWLVVLLPGQASELCPEPSKGFGGVPRGTVLTHQFRLINSSPLPLHVAEVRTSCDCSTVSIPRQEILPGDSVPLTVTIRTAMYAGYRTFTVFVAIDRPDKKEEKLTVSATSVEDIMVDPGTLSLGRLPAGAQAQASVLLDYRGVADGWRLTTVDQSSPHFQVRFTELKRERGLVRYQVQAQWKGTLPPGHWQFPVYLRTNDPYFPRLTIPLEVEVLPVVSVTPSVLLLGVVTTGTQVERKITVRAPRPFCILRAESSDPRCTIALRTTAPQKVHVLTVRFAAGAEGRDAHPHLILHTDLTEQPRVHCEVRAEIPR